MITDVAIKGEVFYCPECGGVGVPSEYSSRTGNPLLSCNKCGSLFSRQRAGTKPGPPSTAEIAVAQPTTANIAAD